MSDAEVDQLLTNLEEILRVEKRRAATRSMARALIAAGCGALAGAVVYVGCLAMIGPPGRHVEVVQPAALEAALNQLRDRRGR